MEPCGCTYSDGRIKFCTLHEEALNLLSVASYALGWLVGIDGKQSPLISRLRTVTDRAIGQTPQPYSRMCLVRGHSTKIWT